MYTDTEFLKIAAEGKSRFFPLAARRKTKSVVYTDEGGTASLKKPSKKKPTKKKGNDEELEEVTSAGKKALAEGYLSN